MPDPCFSLDHDQRRLPHIRIQRRLEIVFALVRHRKFSRRPGIEMPSYAFPFTPAEIERGQLYEFKLNHVVETKDAHELVRTRWVDLSQPGMKVAANG